MIEYLNKTQDPSFAPIAALPETTLQQMENHCLGRHPLNPGDALRLINELRLLRWELEGAYQSIGAPNVVSTRFTP